MPRSDFITGAVARSPRHGSGLLTGLILGTPGPAWLAFFVADIPFWLALLPLGLGLVIGTPAARAIAMGTFLFWPVAISAVGLIGVGLDPWLVAAAAVGLLATLSTLTAFTGITGATALLLAIEVFPASPLLPLAAAVGGLPVPALWMALVLLAAMALDYGVVKRMTQRAMILALIIASLALWQAHGPERDPASQTIATPESRDAAPLWREHPVPQAITERGRWLRLRAQMPEGSTVVLGENIFAAEDREALAFWCRAVITRDLTLFTGVSEPYRHTRRSAVWKLDRESCGAVRRNGNMAIHRAGLGIPGLTGTWATMTGGYDGKAPETATDGTDSPLPAPPVAPAAPPEPPPQDWLICLEAFLPPAWIGIAPVVPSSGRAGREAGPRPILVLSNDSAFGRYAGAMATLRRKAARAMAGLAGHAKRPVFHAGADRTFLLQTDRERTTP